MEVEKDKKTKRQKDKRTRRQKDKKTRRQEDKKTKRQKDKRQRPKKEFNIATSGQFRTLAMFYATPIVPSILDPAKWELILPTSWGNSQQKQFKACQKQFGISDTQTFA